VQLPPPVLPNTGSPEQAGSLRSQASPEKEEALRYRVSHSRSDKGGYAEKTAQRKCLRQNQARFECF